MKRFFPSWAAGQRRPQAGEALPAHAASDPPGAASATGLPGHIGRYRVMQRLGSGATAEVFLARDDFSSRLVAIKRMLVQQEGACEGETDFLPRFFAAEAALVGRLNHPNIVQILDADAHAQPPFLVMEYVPGGTLREFCAADHLLPLDQVVDAGFKCAQALDHVYRQGVVHRDIKPANILYSRSGGHGLDVKISDFGSAFNFTSDQTQVFRVGSLSYMPPEQLDGKDLDHRADQYALCAVLYHLIAGRAPFEAANHGMLVHQIYSQTPLLLDQRRQNLPPALVALVARGLAKDPAERWPDWAQVAQQLADLVSRGDLGQASQQEVLDTERFALLRGLEFFGGFNDVQLWEVARRGHWQRFAAGEALFTPGEIGGRFYILGRGRVEVFRGDLRVADLGSGTSVGEMAYLAPSPELRQHSALVRASEATTALGLTVESMAQFSAETRHCFDQAFIQVLVRRLHAAHESLAHPRQILPPSR
ncbi:serine/threonine-protein kinase [Amphibiibacter pelophylacis]|uniref:Serine/threonine-protein kinase n=1 Tax=Amphibiibacter pelophylacis TaxID=1799477 RepID=A0ACC6P0L9_9BURK